MDRYVRRWLTDRRRMKRMKNEHVFYNGEFIQYIRQNLKYKAANITQPLCNPCMQMCMVQEHNTVSSNCCEHRLTGRVCLNMLLASVHGRASLAPPPLCLLTGNIEHRGPSSCKPTLAEHSTEGESDNVAQQRTGECYGGHL